MTGASDASWSQPTDASPFAVPDGWSGGHVWRDKDGDVHRSWYNTPNGRPANSREDRVESFVVVEYDSRFNGVFAKQYVFGGFGYGTGGFGEHPYGAYGYEHDTTLVYEHVEGGDEEHAAVAEEVIETVRGSEPTLRPVE